MNCTITQIRGRLFLGEIPGTICFVPYDAIDEKGQIRTEIYRKSKWPRKNLRLNQGAMGSQLWPTQNTPEKEAAKKFIRKAKKTLE